MNLRDQHDWKMPIRWCRADICSCKISAKVSLILDNPFLVPSLCQLNHISLCFIQISTNTASLQGKQCFFEAIPGVLGRSVIFKHNIKISIKTACVSRLSVSYDYGFNLFFGMQLGILVLRHTDNSSSTSLQHTHLHMSYKAQ